MEILKEIFTFNFCMFLLIVFSIAFAFKYYDYRYIKKLEKEYKKLGKERYEHAKSIGMFRWF